MKKIRWNKKITFEMITGGLIDDEKHSTETITWYKDDEEFVEILDLDEYCEFEFYNPKGVLVGYIPEVFKTDFDIIE